MGIEFLKKMNEAMPDGIKRRFSFLIRRCLVANDSFLDQYRLLDKLSAASADERLSYQRDQLRGILSFAEANVSYYRKLFHEGGFDPRRLSDVSDLKKLPILTRQTIKENFDDLQALSISDHYEVTTGGSSGEPLRVCLDRPSIYRERAFIYHFWAEHGYDYRSSRIATFRGVDFDGKLVKSNPLYNEIQLNPFFLREDNVASYVKAIEESKADFLHGYPSAIAHFCHLLRKTNHHLKCPLQAVFFVSEDAYAKHYEIVREVLGCEAWAFYGHSERAVFAEQVAFVPEGPLYRFDPLYGVAEIVEHSEGNIVCTGFLNRRMPLIRYAMDDWATLDQGKDSLIAISGHHTDLAFVGLQGEQITQTALNFHDGTFEGIEAYQLVQCRRGEAECRIRSIEPLAADDLDRISRSLISKTGTAIKWTVVQNTPFELTERGKCKTIVSLLGGGGLIF